jgi:hypothetical protein
MKLRITVWGLAGAAVVGLWSLYFMTHPPHHEVPWILLDLSCPIGLLRSRPMSVYLVAAVNAGTYALAGLLVELTRRYGRRARLIPN